MTVYTNDVPKWEAYADLKEHGRALHRSALYLNSFFTSNQGDFFDKLQNKADLTNYLVDGTLPQAILLNVNQGEGSFFERLRRRIDIQFFGIQILKSWNMLKDDALDTYKQDISTYEQIYPDAKHNFRTVYENP